jgi:hypothetical protein
MPEGRPPLVQRLPPPPAPLPQAGGLLDQGAWLQSALDVIGLETLVIDRLEGDT